MLGKGPQRMGDKGSPDINAAGENYRVNTAKVVGGGARVGSSFVVNQFLFVRKKINLTLLKSEENSRAQSSDMENRGSVNGGLSEDIPQPGGCCCGCGWRVWTAET